MIKIKEGIGKKLWCILLALALVLTMMPLTSGTAYAEGSSGDSVTIDLSTVKQDILLGENHSYSLDGGTTYTEYVGNLIFTGTTTEHSIEVNENAGFHDIVLANVSMYNRDKTGCICIGSVSSLNLTLQGTNTLKQNGGTNANSAPAIKLRLGATLKITEASDGSSLTAQGGYAAPAIGGHNEFNLYINGGEVNAFPSNDSAGLGIGLDYGSANCDSTNIEISNAVVNAKSTGNNPAIGSSNSSYGGIFNIKIKNSTVTANAPGSQAAAIGAGVEDKNTYNITIIEKSNVSATSGDYAAAIGTSRSGIAGNIEIIDSIVTASAGEQAAGIGGGPNNNVGNILIQNSTVKASGGCFASGIGGGLQNQKGENDKIILSGSNIYTNNGIGGAAVSVQNKKGNAVTLTTITLQGVSRDVKVTKVETASGYEDVDIMTIDGVQYLYLPEGESPTKVIANGQTYEGTVTDKAGTFSFDHSCAVGDNGKSATCTKPAICGLCNQDFGEKSSHNYEYSAQGNIITETCTNGCGHSATATLQLNTGADLAYTGSEIEPLEVVYSAAWQGAKDLSITYSDNTDVGPASGSITFNGKIATQTFKIGKGTITGITATNYSGEYDAQPHSITVNAPEDTRVSYSTSENGKYSTNNPTYTNVGTYTVYYKVEKDKYNPVTASATVTILQATNTWKEEPSIEGWTYGDTAKTPSKGVAEFGNDVKVEYKLVNAADAEYSETVPTEAGSYKARFSVEGNSNYTPLSKEIDFEIAEATLTDVSVEQSGSLTYTGEPQTASVTAKATAKGNQNVSFTYCDTQDGAYTETVPAFTNAGSHTVYYKAAAANHNEASNSFDVTIGTAQNSWTTAPSISDWIYGKTASIPTGVAKFGEVTVSYSKIESDKTETPLAEAPTEVGNYKAKFTVEGTANYSELTKEVSFSVKKKSSGGAAIPSVPTTDEVTSDKTAGTTTSDTEIKSEEKTDENGNKEMTANVTVSDKNQKDIIDEAKKNDSKEIILDVSKDAVNESTGTSGNIGNNPSGENASGSTDSAKDVIKVDVNLDKDFVESIVNDTDAELTIKTPFGDKTYTQEELKELIEKADGKTITLTITKSEFENAQAEMTAKAKELAGKIKLVARSSKTAKGNIKVTLKVNKEGTSAIKSLKDLGYTIKYKYYRSTKKTSKYAGKITKTGKTFTNIKGIKGTKYKSAGI